MSVAIVTRDLIVAQTRALKLAGVARAFESLARHGTNEFPDGGRILSNIRTSWHHDFEEKMKRAPRRESPRCRDSQNAGARLLF